MNGEVEDRAAADAAAEAEAFAAGFKEETPPVAKPEESPPVTPPAPSAAPVAETPPAEAKAGETPPANEPKPEAKPAKPQYVRITKEQLDDLLAASAKVREFGTRFDKMAGTTGSLKQAIEKLQADTPKGQGFDPAALAALKQDYPEIAGHLEKILGGLKGTGSAEAPKPEAKTKPAEATDADKIKRERDEERFQEELEELNADYPDWQDVVGKSDTPDQKNPFRQWLNDQPADYQKKINDTLSPRVIARAIDRFRAATATPRPPQEQKANPAPKTHAAPARRDVVANAVPPRTAGGAPPVNVKTDLDHFHDGFVGG